MKRIVYISNAAPDLDEAQVERIAAEAVARNAPFDLTGLLAFNGSNFMQALEGADDAVDDVYAAIRRDPRHHGVVTLVEESCEERLFPDWRMRFVRAPREGQAGEQESLSLDDVEECGHVGDLFAGFLRLRSS